MAARYGAAIIDSSEKLDLQHFEYPVLKFYAGRIVPLQIFLLIFLEGSGRDPGHTWEEVIQQNA